ncbi:MAG TPA: 50S ribosomal protein L29 [Flavilitoribacter sp.]|nr:50S ribosomal protein L29 [Flavilitoribacter sp.]HMQ88004.1 50S ribosomal protein L29 [Flavilitoribacter sp.]
MASDKFKELQEFADADLLSELEATEAQYQKMRFDHAVKGMDNPLKLREVRRDIARIRTEMRRRELAGMSGQDLAKRTKIVARRKRK